MLDLNRRIQFRHFKQDIYPSKEEIQEIIFKAMNVSPVRNEVFSFHVNVWGPEYFKEKHELAVAALTSKGKLEDGFQLNDREEWIDSGRGTYDEWWQEMERYYDVHPSAYNLQLEAPWVLTVVEDLEGGHYPKKRRNPDTYDGGDSAEWDGILTDHPDFTRRGMAGWKDNTGSRWQHFINCGIFIHGLALAANDVGVDAAYASCLRTTDVVGLKNNPIMRGYKSTEDGSSAYPKVITNVCMGYYDWSLVGQPGYSSYFNTTDEEGIVERAEGGKYDINKHVRVDGYKMQKPSFEKIVTFK